MSKKLSEYDSMDYMDVRSPLNPINPANPAHDEIMNGCQKKKPETEFDKKLDKFNRAMYGLAIGIIIVVIKRMIEGTL